ncbi:Sister chromatid cohesion 1 protein 1 [Apostasia shenzhenica]|uniref:Sister chromatid cohesion 1 protein 1 n=1 Tax=Apostasia shenzhenica TaxID=1088818 RepID=A0A2I0BHJ8_9ASPA|nr:Sister chromatid cohesion 1 protein 1 [Apostasia shenzhenica]
MSTILEDTPPAHPAEPAAPRLSKETASGYSPKHKNGQMEHTQMEVENQKPEEVWHQTEIAENEQVQRRLKKKARRKSIGVRIDEEMMISNETYQAWLSDASDIKSRMKRMKIIKPLEKLRSLKIEFQMDLPPLCLMMSSTYYLHEIHYPFMELWRKHTIGNPQTPPPIPQKQKLHLFPEEIPLQDFAEFHLQGDFGIEIKRVAGEDQFNLLPGGIPGGSSGSLGGDASQPNLSAETSRKTTSDRSNIKRSSLSIGNLNTVAEDFPLPELAPLEETGPTPTPHPQAFERSVDKITESIRKQLKAHFDTPGNSQVESLNLLAEGLSHKRAALLFYQTCVMATMDYVKVEQVMPYGDIIISRGSMM